jgi:hypothetical protein
MNYDYSKISTPDLQAIYNGDLSKVSTEGLKEYYSQSQIPRLNTNDMLELENPVTSIAKLYDVATNSDITGRINNAAQGFGQGLVDDATGGVNAVINSFRDVFSPEETLRMLQGKSPQQSNLISSPQVNENPKYPEVFNIAKGLGSSAPLAVAPEINAGGRAADIIMNLLGMKAPKMVSNAASAATTAGGYSALGELLSGNNSQSSTQNSPLVDALTNAGKGAELGGGLSLGMDALAKVLHIPQYARSAFANLMLKKASQDPELPRYMADSEYRNNLANPTVISQPSSLGEFTGSPKVKKFEGAIDTLGAKNASKLANKTVNNAYEDYAQNLFDELSNGASPADLNKRLSQAVSNNETAHNSMANDMYNDAFNIANNTGMKVMPNEMLKYQNMPEIAGLLKKETAPQLPAIYDQKGNIINQKPQQGFTPIDAQMAHRVKSELSQKAHDAYAGKGVNFSARDYKNAANALRADMENSANKDFNDAYGAANNYFAQNVAPYRKIKAIRDAAQGNTEQSLTLPRQLMKGETPEALKVLADLTPSQRGLVLAAHLNSLKNLNPVKQGGRHMLNADKFHNELANVPAQTRSALFPHDTGEKFKLLTAMKDLKDNQVKEPFDTKHVIGNVKALAALWSLLKHPALGVGGIVGLRAVAKGLNKVMRSPEVRQGLLNNEKITPAQNDSINTQLRYLGSGRPAAVISNTNQNTR